MRCTPQRLVPAAAAVAHTLRVCLGDVTHARTCILRCPTGPPLASPLACCANAGRQLLQQQRHGQRRAVPSTHPCTRRAQANRMHAAAQAVAGAGGWSPSLGSHSHPPLMPPPCLRLPQSAPSRPPRGHPALRKKEPYGPPAAMHACTRRSGTGGVEAVQPSPPHAPQLLPHVSTFISLTPCSRVAPTLSSSPSSLVIACTQIMICDHSGWRPQMECLVINAQAQRRTPAMSPCTNATVQSNQRGQLAFLPGPCHLLQLGRRAVPPRAG